MSVLNCFPSNDMLCAAYVAVAAAAANDGCTLTVIKTLPPNKNNLLQSKILNPFIRNIDEMEMYH